jgi:hypothetical protein
MHAQEALTHQLVESLVFFEPALWRGFPEPEPENIRYPIGRLLPVAHEQSVTRRTKSASAALKL